MTRTDLAKRVRQRPFVPFRLVLTEGTAYEVRHPEMALLLKGGIYVAVPDSTGDLPEVPVWCSLLHITAIEPISAKNGRPSRKK